MCKHKCAGRVCQAYQFIEADRREYAVRGWRTCRATSSACSAAPAQTRSQLFDRRREQCRHATRDDLTTLTRASRRHREREFLQPLLPAAKVRVPQFRRQAPEPQIRSLPCAHGNPPLSAVGRMSVNRVVSRIESHDVATPRPNPSLSARSARKDRYGRKVRLKTSAKPEHAGIRPKPLCDAAITTTVPRRTIRAAMGGEPAGGVTALRGIGLAEPACRTLPLADCFSRGERERGAVWTAWPSTGLSFSKLGDPK